MAETDEFLKIALAYCLTWEIAGSRAPGFWEELRAFKDRCDLLDEKELWMSELYEESSPTAQEERSILARIEARLDHPRAVLGFRKEILGILPASIRDAAEKHRLMKALVLPRAQGRVRTWLNQYKMASAKTHPERGNLPLAEREAEFIRFLEYPHFLEGFRQYWKQAPKVRNGRETRQLLYFAAAFSQMVHCEETAEFEAWSRRFARACSFSAQTESDTLELGLEMLDQSYDAQSLAYRIFVDVNEVNRANLIQFCRKYEDKLTTFSQELVRALSLV
jgi:hypothetical protein